MESTRRDLREARLQESQITEAYVRFVFDLTELEALEISNSAKKQILSKNYELPIITVSGLDNTLDRFCASQQGLYIADIISGKKRFSVWALKDAQVKPNWKKIGPAWATDFTVSTDGSSAVPLKNFTLVNILDFPDIPPPQLPEKIL